MHRIIFQRVSEQSFICPSAKHERIIWMLKSLPLDFMFACLSWWYIWMWMELDCSTCELMIVIMIVMVGSINKVLACYMWNSLPSLCLINFQEFHKSFLRIDLTIVAFWMPNNFFTCCTKHLAVCFSHKCSCTLDQYVLYLFILGA